MDTFYAILFLLLSGGYVVRGWAAIFSALVEAISSPAPLDDAVQVFSRADINPLLFIAAHVVFVGLVMHQVRWMRANRGAFLGDYSSTGVGAGSAAGLAGFGFLWAVGKGASVARHGNSVNWTIIGALLAAVAASFLVVWAVQRISSGRQASHILGRGEIQA